MHAADEKLTHHSYYAATCEALPEQPSLHGTQTFDVCVVGAGLAGLSAALELAQAGYRVAVLEGKRIAWGASGRNGGQAIAGYACDQELLEKQLGIADARLAFDITLEGLDLMRERISIHQIDCDWIDGYMTASVKPKSTPDLYAWADKMADVYDYPHLQKIPPAQMPDWIASTRYHGAVLDTNSAHLHPLKYAIGLARAAMAAGATIFENSMVTDLIHGEPARVKTAHGQINADFVVLAGNVYLDQVAPTIAKRIMPVGTYIVTTAPLEPDFAAGLIQNRVAVSDNNNILDYFRVTKDNRMLFGGRVSYSGVTPPNLTAAMRRTMLRAFPQLVDAPIEYCWGGFVDITVNRAPDFGRLAKNIYYLQGFSGHGLILTGIAGKLAAQAIMGQAERFDVFTRLKHMPFLGGKWMRTPALVLAMAYFRLRDIL